VTQADGQSSGPSPSTQSAPLRVAPLPMPPLTTAAGAPRVEIAFEYTFDELREGLAQSPDMKQRKRMKPAAKIVSLGGWLLFVAMAMLLFLLLNKTGAKVGTPGIIPARPPGIDVMSAVAPSIFAAAFVGIFAGMIAAFMVIQTSKSERVRRGGKYILIGGMIGFALLMWWAMTLIFSPPRPADVWHITRAQAVMLALAPWVLVIILVVMFTVWASRSHLRRMWNSKPYLRRRRTVVFDVDGEHVHDEFTELFYRWSYFRRAWETEHCVVLEDENAIRHIIPKRPTDPPTLDALRSIISNHVADTKFLTTPGGFPVGMATAYAAPPALPVQPGPPASARPS